MFVHSGWTQGSGHATEHSFFGGRWTQRENYHPGLGLRSQGCSAVQGLYPRNTGLLRLFIYQRSGLLQPSGDGDFSEQLCGENIQWKLEERLCWPQFQQQHFVPLLLQLSRSVFVFLFLFHFKENIPIILQHNYRTTVFFGHIGKWKTAFQPEKTSLQEFYVNPTTTVMSPMMTRTGHYHYLNDKVRSSTRKLVAAFMQEFNWHVFGLPTCSWGGARFWSCLWANRPTWCWSCLMKGSTSVTLRRKQTYIQMFFLPGIRTYRKGEYCPGFDPVLRHF